MSVDFWSSEVVQYWVKPLVVIAILFLIFYVPLAWMVTGISLSYVPSFVYFYIAMFSLFISSFVSMAMID